MNDLLLPGYDRWLDSPFEREMDARARDEEDNGDDLDGLEEDLREDDDED